MRYSRILLALVTLSVCGCALPMRGVIYLHPDLKDHRWLHAHEIKAPAQPFRFHEAGPNNLGKEIGLNDWSPAVVPVWRTLNEMVQAHPNQALVIIRNDTVLYSHYNGDAVLVLSESALKHEFEFRC